MDQSDGKSAESIKSEQRIKAAGYAGCALALITLLQFLFPFAAGLSPAVVASGVLNAIIGSSGTSNVSILGLPPFAVFSALCLAIVAAMTVGIFKKNKICSVVLFSYAVVALVFSLSTAWGLAIISTAVILTILIFLFFGMLGTFDYQQNKYRAAEPGKNAA